ncbi:MAG: hypothetical protein WBW48_17390 [Anaerolineae bacterium]
MRLGRPLVAGTFIQRDNRFRAMVEVRGQPVWAHVTNFGPTSGQALREAANAGLEVYAYLCRVSRDEVGVDRPIPVVLQPSSVGRP